MTRTDSPIDADRKLLPCPFCGASAHIYENEVDYVTKWSAGCDECNADFDACEDTKAEAAAAWNTRAPRRDEPVDRLEAAADAIDEARYQHPDRPRERPRPFSEADRHDREYALRLARAAIRALAHPAASQGGVPGCGVPGCNDPTCDYGQEPAPSRPAAQPMREALIEQCAKIAENQASAWLNGDARTGIGQAYQRACSDVAAKIRAALAPAIANEVKR